MLLQHQKQREIEQAPHMAAMAAKEALENTLEALELKRKVRALKKEIQDISKELYASTFPANELTLKLELEDLGDAEREELNRQFKVNRENHRRMVLKVRELKDCIYKLGPPNPHKELGEDFARKQGMIVEILRELDKLLEDLQERDNDPGQDIDHDQLKETKDEIKKYYSEWKSISRNYDIAKAGIFHQKAVLSHQSRGDTRPVEELWHPPEPQDHEIYQEQVELEGRVMLGRIGLLREAQKIAHDDPVKSEELEQEIQARFVVYNAAAKKYREPVVNHLRKEGYEPPPERDHDMDSYVEEQMKKTDEEHPLASKQDKKKTLEERWQVMTPEERESYKEQAEATSCRAFFQALKDRPKPPPIKWENFDPI